MQEAVWISLGGLSDFDLGQTLESGQCFRYVRQEKGYLVIAGCQHAVFFQEGSTLHTTATQEALHSFWIPYFDLERDYAAIKRHISKDPVMAKACAFGHGVRVINQDFFETLITFIISQQNNIPRIQGIVAALCQHFGNPLQGGATYCGFPTAQTLCALRAEDLEPIHAGYRAPYILDAARKFAEGAICETEIRRLPYGEAKAKLKTIQGVGDKVANCVLLFGAGHTDAFPIDVWIQRSIDSLYDGTLDAGQFSPFGGFAQQYLFYYIRKQAEQRKGKGTL